MRKIKFPQDQTVGKILISKRHDETDWDESVEAKGEIIIPENRYVSFWLGAKLSFTDLKFLESVKADDLDEFAAASSYFDDSNTQKILHLSGLSSLQLWETKITDSTLRLISNFPKLRVLGVDTTKITDDGLLYLAELPSLESLSLYCNDINGNGLSYLTKLKLKNLDIGWTEVDDDSIEFLKQIKTLKYLRIYNTKIREDGFFELKNSLPDCLIQFYKPNDI